MYICDVKGGCNARQFLNYFFNIVKMSIKEIRKDIYTQSEYAKILGVSRARVNQMVKAGELKTLTVNGAVLIKR